jgi:hypothetical protein
VGSIDIGNWRASNFLNKLMRWLQSLLLLHNQKQ